KGLTATSPALRKNSLSHSPDHLRPEYRAFRIDRAMACTFSRRVLALLLLGLLLGFSESKPHHLFRLLKF
ncbi:MAG: hypothetical protein QXT96_06080, partial [Candidatus Bathyarchaeia archaeon]